VRGRQPKPRTAPEPPAVAGARWIPLTRGKFALVDEEDYEALSQYHWFFSGRGYAERAGAVRGQIVRMHRVVAGATAGVEVDHVSGDRLDNRRQNLRLATRSQNACNHRIRRDNTSGFKGVTWSAPHKQWRVNVRVDGKRHYVGLFRDPVEAAKAYDKAAKQHHGEFARLNFADKESV
jgi:hypothetical protein